MPRGLRDQLESAHAKYGPTGSGGDLTVAAWVFTRDWQHVLLVDHPRFGWSPPGGRLEAGEHPAAGAVRELGEETGVRATPLHGVPVAVLNSVSMVCFAYAFTVRDRSVVRGEAGQAARWFPLADYPTSDAFPLDAFRVRQAAAALAGGLHLPDMTSADAATLMDHALGHPVDPTELRFAAQAAALVADRQGNKRNVYLDIASVA